MALDNQLYNIQRHLHKFKVVGLIPSIHFQKCCYLVEKLHSCYPKEYDQPEIRAMLNLDWELYLTKMKRRHGKPYYLLKTPVAVYFNEELLGDDSSLMNFIGEKFKMEININFEDSVEKGLINYFENIIKKHQRKFAFLTIAIDEHVVGSMLFMLYNDLVPITCDNFLNRCTDHSHAYGYKGTKIHRIAKYSWVQCGGFGLQHIHMPCENYSVPHDRRGVLSMCNKRRHVDNSTQFFIILERASWMDYNYVAFGQLIQGAEILNLIEKITTYNQSPGHKIEIVNCGEFSLCPARDDEYVQVLNPKYSAIFAEEFKPDDADSVLSETGYKTGKYYLRTDVKSYLPFTRYSRMFDSYLKLPDEPIEGICDVNLTKTLRNIEEPDEENNSDEDLKNSLFKSSPAFYHKQHLKFEIIK